MCYNIKEYICGRFFMNSRSGRAQTIRHNYMKIYGLTAALCVVVALAVALTALQLGSFSGRAPSVTDPTTQGSSPAASESSPTGTSPAAPTSEDKHAAFEVLTYGEAELKAVNPLLIVDAAHPFDPSGAKDLAVIKTTEPPADGKQPSVFTWSNQMNAEALTALQRLQKAMTDKFGDEGQLFVNISYTFDISDVQGGLNIGLSAAKCADKNCTDPGHSDHATGYAVDIRYNDGKYLTDAVKAEQTAYLQSVCASFGFVQSWVQKGLLTQGKTQGDTWHFRYVGVPHALYMAANGLSFDGYMEALRATNINKHLSVPSADGAGSYEMYFIGYNANGATDVRVPTGSNYTVWGNGVDGFIVTIAPQTSAA